MTTTDDMARLLPEARAAAEKSGALALNERDPRILTSDATDMVQAIIWALASPTVEWGKVRTFALRAAWLLLIVAWEAGRKMCAGGITWPKDCKEHGTHYTDAHSAAAWAVAKRSDVDELLLQVSDWRREWDGRMYRVGPDRRLVDSLADALRAERTRFNRTEDERSYARIYLRNVLVHFSPDPTRGPTVAQKAHAFLGGAAIHPLAQDEADANLRAELSKVREERDTAQVSLGRTTSEANIARFDLRERERDLVEARAGMTALAEEKERLRQAALAVLHMRDARDGNGGRLIAKPCSSGSCKGTVCGPAAELQARIDALAIAASKGEA